MASKYVISAAHCFMNTDANGIINGPPTPASDVRVWIGDHDLDTDGDLFSSLQEKKIDVVSLIHHDNYSTAVGNYAAKPWDLTVMELAETVDLKMYTPSLYGIDN